MVAELVSCSVRGAAAPPPVLLLLQPEIDSVDRVRTKKMNNQTCFLRGRKMAAGNRSRGAQIIDEKVVGRVSVKTVVIS
jgi:hypothetical protein